MPASSSHRKILVKNITKKEKILNTITDVDPLEKQRLADEDVRKAMKMKRQMESRKDYRKRSGREAVVLEHKKVHMKGLNEPMRVRGMMRMMILLLAMKKRLKSMRRKRSLSAEQRG